MSPQLGTRRIFGLETEVGIALESPGQLGPEDVARTMFRPVVSWGRSSNVFLPNGARLYLDVGSHPEYATGECDDLMQLVAHDRAGDLILQGMAENSERVLQEQGSGVRVHLIKNNSDMAGNSFGAHENYLVHRGISLQRYTDVLIPFFVSRTLLTGSGGIVSTPKGARFVLSPRADHVWDSVSSSTTRSRPMINSRDEPHADPEKFRRLHVIVGDSSRAEPAVFLKFGATDLMLRMIEGGVVFGDIKIAHPIKALRAVANDISGQEPIELVSGRSTTALDLQERFVTAAQNFVEKSGDESSSIEQDRRVLTLWQRSIDALRQRDLDALSADLDWVIKYRILDRYQQRTGASWADPRLQRLDLAYHDLSPERGVFQRLEDSGSVNRFTQPISVLEAMSRPPQSTRAKIRGDFVRQAQLHNIEYTVDWVHMRVNSPPTRTVACRDPFAAVDDRVDELIESADRAGR